MGGEDPNKALNQAYDPVADNWTTKAPIPYMVTEGEHSAADYSASAVVDDKIYWIGVTGFYYSPLGMRILAQLYNPVNDSWSLRASPPDSLPTQLPEAAATTSGKWAPQRIYMFGSGAHVAYDPAIDKWSFTARMPSPHYVFGLAVVEDNLYAIGGGYIFSACELNLEYTPFGYGTVSPAISIAAPQNSTFTGKNSLVFNVNKPVASMSYILDGQANSTFTGNLTLTEVPLGAHNVTVYATDSFGNVGASGTIVFNVEQPPLEGDSFTFVLVGVALAVVAVAAAGSLIYLRKHRKPTAGTKPSL
jgi:hypothetical protein